MSNNKKPKDILKDIQLIFEDIIKNTDWKPIRYPKDIEIEFGDAPEYYENFGVIREKNKLVIGLWIDNVKPKVLGIHFLEFIQIRECFSLFFDDNLLFGNQSVLISLFLNLLALSYLQMKDPVSSSEIKSVPIQGRFLLPIKNEESHYKEEIHSIIYSLLDIINQGTSYKMLYNTFMSFIEDIELDDIESEEILDDLRRYLLKDPEEITAPIFLKRNTTEVLRSLIEHGSNASAIKIAEALNINQSTVTRQIAKLSSKYYTRWRLEKNYSRLGLFSYILIIRYSSYSKAYMEGIYDDLFEIKYFKEFYEGGNEEFKFQYALIYCPHLISEKIARKLSNYKQKGMIDSFVLKSIKNRTFRTTIVDKPFKPTLINFKKLIDEEIQSTRFVLWDTFHHKNHEKELIEKKDENVLKYISIIISKSLSQFGLFGAYMAELQEFVEENGYDLNKTPECLSFINKLQNRAFEMELIDFRFNISLAGVASSNMCIFIIKKSKNELSKFIEKIACFAWISIIDTIENIYFLILGPTFESSIISHLKSLIREKGFDYECFSVRQKTFRYINYNSLYDFSSQKWSL
ncbi:MAG: LysR family transcriptional regulator [Candidatus Heimdallarchaeota archaeon]|nr:LysR family transcriptional regulator [Candidatus Heimdallarchaeota archaeon]